MKKTALAIISALSICAHSLQAQDNAFSFGVRGGLVNSGILGLDEATKPFSGNNTIINPWVNLGLYGEYAFHDNVGAGLDIFYTAKRGGFVSKQNKDNNYTIAIHQISAMPMVKFYPLGREEDEGVLSIHVGGIFSFPMMASGQEKNKDSQSIDGANLSIGMGLSGGGDYEFPFGLLIGLRGGYDFTSVFKEDAVFKTQTLGIPKDKGNPAWHANLQVGYNFAKLLM